MEEKSNNNNDQNVYAECRGPNNSAKRELDYWSILQSERFKNSSLNTKKLGANTIVS